MNIIKRLLLTIAISLLFAGEGMSSPISKSWIYATILIENEWNERGTGFLVARKINDDQLRFFLCTNKHVLNKDPLLRQSATRITCNINVKKQNGQIVGKPYPINLNFPDGSKRWKEHPDPIVDVLVFDITDLLNAIPEMQKKWAEYSLFADSNILSSQDITIGDEIMIIGYPLGFHQGETNFPIVRQGIIATQIGQTFTQEVADNSGKMIQRTYRGFLIDGGAIPGSSGSPVILKPVTGRFVGDNIMMGAPQPYLLGILAETRFAPIKVGNVTIPSFAGLGLAFDAVTIKETIELFFP